jgi:hypothetical protein
LLEYLHLGSNGISVEGAGEIARLIMVGGSTHHANHHGNAGSPPTPTRPLGLKQLDLSNNMLGDHGAAEIARALGGGQLGGEGMEGGSQPPMMLTSLNLQLNNISDMGAFLLGTALQANDTLMELDLRHNSISPEMLALVQDGLERNRMKHFATAAAEAATAAELAVAEIAHPY